MDIDTILLSIGTALIASGLTYSTNFVTGTTVGIGIGMIGIQARGGF